MATEDEQDQPEEKVSGDQPAAEGTSGQQTQIEVKVDGEKNTTSTAGRDVINNFFFNSDAQGSAPSPFARGVRPEEKHVTTEPILPPDPSKIEDVTRWFRELKNPRRQYFVLLLSMFSGLKWFQFSAIHQGWLNAKKLVDKDVPPDPFGETDEELLKAVCAKRTWDEKRAAEIVEFQERDYRGAILEMMRRSFRLQLDELLDYLRHLGENDDWEIRARASQAVAEIAKKDFYLVRENVFERWARDDRAFVRAAVGYGAAKLIQENTMADQVHQMLRDWGRPGSAWKLAWAAAAACKQIGIEQPEPAFRDLGVVAGYDDIRVTDAVIYALVVISLEGHLDKVMGVLKTWAEGDNRVVYITAVLAFGVLASGYTELALDKAEGTSTRDDVTDLLRLLADGETARATAAGLMVRAFEFKLWDLVFNIAAGWARQSAASPALQDAACDIVVTMYRELTPLRMGQVISRLGQWETGKDKDLAQFAAVAKKRLKASMLGEVESPLRQAAAPKSIEFGS